MTDRHEQHEFADLVDAVIDGRANDTQLRQLDEIIASDPAARRYYVEHMALLTCFERSTLAAAGALDEPADVPSDVLTDVPADDPLSTCSTSWLDRASRHPLPPSVAVAVAVLLALLVGLAIMPVGRWIASDDDAERDTPPAEAEHVAILADWREAVWLDGTRPPREHPRLKVGQRLVLDSGLIEIKYLTGAAVVIEGPAEFVVGRRDQPPSDLPPAAGAAEDNRGYLKRGKLVARCETLWSRGFTIETPTGLVEDLGTEFSVDVDLRGDARTHVFAGRVRVSSTADAAVAWNQELRAGEGIAWNAAGDVHVLSEPLGKRYARVARPLRQDDVGRIVSDLGPGLLVRPFQSGAPRVSKPEGYKIVDAPASLAGLTAIIAPRGPGLANPGAGYRFRVTEPARLYLLVHDRGEHSVDGWQRTADSVTWTVAGQTHTDTVYTRPAETGAVDIPTHSWRDKESQYGVPHICLVAPQAEPTSEPSEETENESNP